ncbi:MAG: hypothetical protein ACRDZX_00320 [Acidimicrobiales bacterium]
MAHTDPEHPTSASAGGTDAVDEVGGADLGYEGELGEYDDFDGSGERSEAEETIDEAGRRHIRRAAPEGTEEILESEVPRHTGLPDRAERWRMRSATGTVLSAVAFGLQEVFEPERNQPAIVMETSGDPPKDLPVEAQLRQLGPRQSSVTVRSWLLGNNLPGTATGGTEGSDTGGATGSDTGGSAGHAPGSASGRAAHEDPSGTGGATPAAGGTATARPEEPEGEAGSR